MNSRWQAYRDAAVKILDAVKTDPSKASKIKVLDNGTIWPLSDGGAFVECVIWVAQEDLHDAD